MTCNNENLPYSSSQDQIAELVKKLEVLHINPEQVQALFHRAEDAVTYGMALDKTDGRTLIEMGKSYAHLHEQLEANELTIKKLRKLLGMEPSSEKHESKGRVPTDSEADGTEPEKGEESKETKPPRKPRLGGHGKRGSEDFGDAQVEHHKLEGLSKGDPCPECPGKLYKYQPSVQIRISGHNPYEVTKHICERLRCNTCGKYFTADASEEATADGPIGQRFGYSARALIAIDKYMAGSPFYRQQNLTKILGDPISASTAFDQCEKLANAGHAIHKMLSQIASRASNFFIDDTNNRIRDAKPIEKNGRKRTGVYTSALIADGEKRVVLFKTNIGHAGEFLDQILAMRPNDLATPIVMSDALSSNHITKRTIIKTLCNSHARREFHNLLSMEPKYIEPLLDLYQEVFRNEGVCRKEGHSVEERLAYHQKKSLPLMEKIRSQAGSLLQDERIFEENSLFGKAFAYFDRHWDGLTAFCRIPGAALDNNLSERTLKIIILGKKNAYYYRTNAGAAVSDTITSLLATCKSNDINPFIYLRAIQRYQDYVKENPANWLPWNYQDTIATI